jgi:DNA polymerase III epsilon subunit-like protein
MITTTPATHDTNDSDVAPCQQEDPPTKRSGTILPNLDLSQIDAQSMPYDEYAALSDSISAMDIQSVQNASPNRSMRSNWEENIRLTTHFDGSDSDDDNHDGDVPIHRFVFRGRSPQNWESQDKAKESPMATSYSYYVPHTVHVPHELFDPMNLPEPPSVVHPTVVYPPVAHGNQPEQQANNVAHNPPVLHPLTANPVTVQRNQQQPRSQRQNQQQPRNQPQPRNQQLAHVGTAPQNHHENPPITSPPLHQRGPNLVMDLPKAVYVVFDLVTTERWKLRHYIIELAAIILDSNGDELEDTQFNELVHSPIPIPVTNISGISNDDVCYAQGFQHIGYQFFAFIADVLALYPRTYDYIVLVTHKGRSFGAPFLFHQLQQFEITQHQLLMNKMYLLNTHDLAFGAIRSPSWGDTPAPDNYQLGTLFRFVAHLDLQGHCALPDVLATARILRYFRFWNRRLRYIYKLQNDGSVVLSNNEAPAILLPNDDSDTDEDVPEDNANQADNGNESDDDEQQVPGTGWQRNTHFEGLDTMHLFLNSLQRQLGLTGILNEVVANTNEYGNLLCRNWSACFVDSRSTTHGVARLQSFVQGCRIHESTDQSIQSFICSWTST